MSTPSPPESMNVVTDSIALGNVTLFSTPILSGSDDSLIRFFTVEGTYGQLVGTIDGITCDTSQPLVALQGYPASSPTPSWNFCYWANGPGSAYGNDTFFYQVEDNSVVSTSNYTVTAVVLFPIQGCSIPGAEDTCTAATNESLPVVILLNGYDWRLTEEEQDLWYEITSLPSHGTLYLTSNVSERVRNGTRYRGNFTYLPDSTYYNRVGSDGFATLLGDGLDGCITPDSSVSCPCPIAVAPGCPDTFTYLVISEPSGEVTPTVSTFNLYVEVILTTDVYITAPSIITVHSNETYMFNTTDTTVYITDPDADLNWIGLDVTISGVGVTGMDVSSIIYRNTTYYIWTQCPQYVELGACTEVRVFGTSSRLNLVLEDLYYQSMVSVRNKNVKLVISVYKTTTPIVPSNGFIPGEGEITSIAQANAIVKMNSSDIVPPDDTAYYFGLFLSAIILGCFLCACAAFGAVATCAYSMYSTVYNVFTTVFAPCIWVASCLTNLYIGDSDKDDD